MVQEVLIMTDYSSQLMHWGGLLMRIWKNDSQIILIGKEEESLTLVICLDNLKVVLELK